MSPSQKIEAVLRLSVAGEFVGHGVFALQGKQDWIRWIQQLIGTDPALSTQLLFLIGLADLVMALFVLFRPIRFLLLWAAFWGFWTALVRPLVGLPLWDFIERWANWGAPLALLLLKGWPTNFKMWFR